MYEVLVRTHPKQTEAEVWGFAQKQSGESRAHVYRRVKDLIVGWLQRRRGGPGFAEINLRLI